MSLAACRNRCYKKHGLRHPPTGGNTLINLKSKFYKSFHKLLIKGSAIKKHNYIKFSAGSVLMHCVENTKINWTVYLV